MKRFKKKFNNQKNQSSKPLIKDRYSWRDLDNPNYDPSYDQDSTDNLYEYVTKTMDEEFD